ncbi:hypothetical protein GCM10009119_06960 [Algoriphagus jejuensis]|uniref:HEPN AbiU2-like domain-containing protein n=1 Tax=Algoriphagus jejuensis TaxID=419934 RepID=A0ABN1MXF4_9BACT
MLITSDTKSNLLNNVETRLNERSSELDNLVNLFSRLEAFEKFLNEQKISSPFEGLKNLLNFRIIVGIIYLDLCAATLTYLRGKYQYEAINASRQMIVVINEGYKKLYHFDTNKKGEKNLKNRNESFWVKEVGQIINTHLPEYRQQYKTLTQKFNNYLSVNFELLEMQRNLSVHYDKEPMKVYKMMTELDIEESFKKLIPFLDILNSLFVFTQEVAGGFQKKTEQSNLKQDQRIDSIVGLIDKHKSVENEKLINEFKEQILSLKKLYRR